MDCFDALPRLSRREWLRVGTFALAGLVVSPARAAAPKGELTAAPIEPPWPYPEFDVARVRKQAYTYKHERGCMYGVIRAVVEAAAAKYPQPWQSLPLAAFGYGRSGGYGWGTLCGALNGGLLVLSLALGDCPAAADALMQWYVHTPLPSRDHDGYGRFPQQPQAVPGSPLCHPSVSAWVESSGSVVHSAQRKERCAKLCGDTAGRVGEILNGAMAGHATVAAPAFAANAACMTCHGTKGALPDDVISKMHCRDCHADPHDPAG